MKRDDWTVPYTGSQLLDATVLKSIFHNERLSWWRKKKEDLMTDIRANGIEINESIVDQLGKTGYFTNNNRGLGAPTIEINVEMKGHLTEAHFKVEEHNMKLKEYGAWEQMLQSHQSSNFDLDNDDWMYFFGK